MAERGHPNLGEYSRQLMLKSSNAGERSAIGHLRYLLEEKGLKCASEPNTVESESMIARMDSVTQGVDHEN